MVVDPPMGWIKGRVKSFGRPNHAHNHISDVFWSMPAVYHTFHRCIGRPERRDQTFLNPITVHYGTKSPPKCKRGGLNQPPRLLCKVSRSPSPGPSPSGCLHRPFCPNRKCWTRGGSPPPRWVDRRLTGQWNGGALHKKMTPGFLSVECVENTNEIFS